MTATASLVNQTIGNYRVLRLLGEGGMGVVYLAQHPVIGRKVAIKLLHAALARDPDIVSRFFNEARAIHMIAHENIVEILDFGQTTDGQPYFIMEHLEGESLSEAVSRGPMAVDQVELIGVQMCRALGAAHAKGIVHRDLKPHNVQLGMKTDDSGADGALQVKILDFGVAKILATPDGAQSVKTRTGSLMGTPLYMSPEQCKGAGVLDHRTDIYSLGVMLFEMIAGRPPFVAEGVGELFAKHMLEDPPSLLELAPATPPHMAAAIMKALAKEPADRFQSMDELRKALIGEVKLPASPPRAGARRAELGSAPASSPRAATTLSSASSELDDSAMAPARTRKLVIAGGAAVAAVLLIALLMPKKHPSASPPPVAATSPAPEPAPAPAAGPAPEAVAAKPDSKTVTIRFEADPPGAHVLDEKDGKDLGAVPIEVQLPKGGEPSKYKLRLTGYREVPLTATPTADRTMHVVLDKVPAATAAAGESKHRPTHHTKRKSVIDEDGLAMPSF
ncbi:MAG TPA: serine/threonine-protein kinase [Polyangia bacterium]|nr:serine/threonine-protein kinase [Polyangia bacterium]